MTTMLWKAFESSSRLLPEVCPWDGYAPGTVRFCEERLCSWVVEPANAWSNVGFLLVGLALFWRSHRKGRLGSPLVLFGVTGVLVSVGSLLFHMTGTFWGEFLDVSAMFLISSLMLTLDLRHHLGFDTRAAIGTYSGIAASSILALAAYRTVGIGLFIAHITVWTLLVIGLAMRRPLYRTGLLAKLMAIFMFGYGVWNLDFYGVLCNPQNHVFTGHSFWHFTGATSLFLYYLHQERIEERLLVARSSPTANPSALES